MKKAVIVLLLVKSAYGISDNEIHTYLWANYHQFKKEDALAKKSYEKILTPHCSIYAYKGYVYHLFNTGNFSAIVQLIPKLDPVFSADIDLQMIFSQALAHTGAQTASDERILKLNTIDKTNQDVAFAAAQIYIRRKELENALVVINNFLNSGTQRPNNFIFYFLQSQIYTQLNEKEKALSSVHKSLDMYPRFDKSWLLMAMLEEQAGNLENAIKGYSYFMQTTKEPTAQIQQHLVQLLFQQKLLAQKNHASDDQSQKLSEAIRLFEQKQYQHALKQLNAYLEHAPADTKGRLLKVQILNELQAYDQLTGAIKEWLLEDPSQEIWYKTLHALTRNGLPNGHAVAVLKAVEKKYTTALFPALYLADLFIRTNHQPSAIPMLKKALRVTHDAEVKAALSFQLALLYYEQRQFTSMKKNAEHALTYNSSFAPVLNLLAYYYASKEDNLTTAQSLLNKALAQDPHNPHFLDTQARIWYKQKEYQKALPLLQSLAQKEPHDFTILRHLSKSLYQTGRTQEALSLVSHIIASAPAHEKQKVERLLKQWKQKKV
jgi:tetratricopeptide (TPR) repeat protein